MDGSNGVRGTPSHSSPPPFFGTSGDKGECKLNSLLQTHTKMQNKNNATMIAKECSKTVGTGGELAHSLVDSMNADLSEVVSKY